MSDIIIAFKEYLTIIKSLASNSIDSYISDLSEFEAFLIEKNSTLLNSTSEDLIEYLQLIKNPNTQNRHLSSINSFYKFAEESFDDILKPKAPFAKLPKKLPKYLSDEQILKNLTLIDKSNETGLRDYAIILFLYATGVRVSELINIKKNDIEKNWIRVLFAKGSKQRIVPIANVALQALNEYLENRSKKSEYLFINYKGDPLSRVSVFKICKKYYDVSPHVFRHSYATSLILGGADLMVVSELLGHSNLETTQIYTHIQQKHLAQTVASHHPLSKKGNR
jgi:integrase/recombinase XerD